MAGITRRRGMLSVLACAILVPAAAVEAHAKAPADYWPNSPARHAQRTAVPAATPSFAANLRGGLTTAGDTLMTCPQNLAATRARGTSAAEPCLNADNNDRDMRYVNVDPGGGRFNSSTAQLSIPGDARVVRAFLYWGADLARGVQNGAAAGAPGGETPESNTLWRAGAPAPRRRPVRERRRGRPAARRALGRGAELVLAAGQSPGLRLPGARRRDARRPQRLSGDDAPQGLQHGQQARRRRPSPTCRPGRATTATRAGRCSWCGRARALPGAT